MARRKKIEVVKEEKVESVAQPREGLEFHLDRDLNDPRRLQSQPVEG